MARTPKTTTHKIHPTNILREEKHSHGIALALPEKNLAFKTTK